MFDIESPMIYYKSISTYWKCVEGDMQSW